VRRSWCSSLLAAAALSAAALAAPAPPVPLAPPTPQAPREARPASRQSPTYRVTYHLQLMERTSATRVLATGVVSGPPGTNLRLSLSTARAELEGLLGMLPEPDTVNLAGLFFSRRHAGRSRRDLPLWEEDSYRQWARIGWGGTVRLYPFGPLRPGQRHALWVEIAVIREFAAGETRPSEEMTIIDTTVTFDAQAVLPPRRVMVRLALVRGDTASSTRTLDLVPEAPGRRVSFALGGEMTAFDVALERPQPPRTGRDSALAVDADLVCLRVFAPVAAEPARHRCGRLDNVARRLALVSGDTLVATFAWPGSR
jgi:hypothetical protein